MNEPNQLPDPITVTWCFFEAAPRVAIVDLNLLYTFNGELEQEKRAHLRVKCEMLYTLLLER